MEGKTLPHMQTLPVYGHTDRLFGARNDAFKTIILFLTMNLLKSYYILPVKRERDK